MNLSDHPYLLSILLGIIEGLTEFLPVSSTAHLRLVKPWLFGDPDILQDPYWKMYDVVIQLGAILAVVVYFRSRLLAFVRTFPCGSAGDRTAFNHPLSLVMLAFVVTAVPSLLLVPKIKENLESLTVMGLSLLVGGIVMWVIDAMFGEKNPPPMPEEKHEGPDSPAARPVPSEGRGRYRLVRTMRMDDISALQAAWIGAFQVLAAVFPGTSRSMSTIAAGQTAGLSRTAALEFSFFVSIPIMFAACGYDLLRTVTAEPGDLHHLGRPLTSQDWGVLATGFFVSLVVAWVVIAWFMAWVRRRGFVPFAIYRILLGLAVLAWLWSRGG